MYVPLCELEAANAREGIKTAVKLRDILGTFYYVRSSERPRGH